MPFRKDSSSRILETPSLNLDNPVRDTLISTKERRVKLTWYSKLFIILSLAEQQKINDHIFCSGLLIFYKVSERVHSCAEDYTLFNLINKKTLSTIGFVFQTLKSCHWWIFPASHFYKIATGSAVLCVFSCNVRHIEASYLKLASGLGSTRL